MIEIEYGPDSSRSYFADLALRQWHTRHGEPPVSLADAEIASARDAYVRDAIEIDEFERRVAEALA